MTELTIIDDKADLMIAGDLAGAGIRENLNNEPTTRANP